MQLIRRKIIAVLLAPAIWLAAVLFYSPNALAQSWQRECVSAHDASVTIKCPEVKWKPLTAAELRFIARHKARAEAYRRSLGTPEQQYAAAMERQKRYLEFCAQPGAASNLCGYMAQMGYQPR